MYKFRLVVTISNFNINLVFYSLAGSKFRLEFLEGLAPMEQHIFKNVNNCLNTNIYSYLETLGGQSCCLYLNVIHFFNTSVNQTSVAA